MAQLIVRSVHDNILSCLCYVTSLSTAETDTVPGRLMIDKIMIDVRVRPNPFRFDALNRPTEDRTWDEMISARPTLRHRTQSQSNVYSRPGRQCDDDDEWLDDVVVAMMIDGKTMRGGLIYCRRCLIYLRHDIDGVLFVAC